MVRHRSARARQRSSTALQAPKQTRTLPGAALREKNLNIRNVCALTGTSRQRRRAPFGEVAGLLASKSEEEVVAALCLRTRRAGPTRTNVPSSRLAVKRMGSAAEGERSMTSFDLLSARKNARRALSRARTWEHCTMPCRPAAPLAACLSWHGADRHRGAVLGAPGSDSCRIPLSRRPAMLTKSPSGRPHGRRVAVPAGTVLR